MLKGLLKADRQPKVSPEMKSTNEKLTWNAQDSNLSSYVPKAKVDNTTSGQEIAWQCKTSLIQSSCLVDYQYMYDES